MGGQDGQFRPDQGGVMFDHAPRTPGNEAGYALDGLDSVVQCVVEEIALVRCN